MGPPPGPRKICSAAGCLRILPRTAAWRSACSESGTVPRRHRPLANCGEFWSHWERCLAGSGRQVGAPLRTSDRGRKPSCKDEPFFGFLGPTSLRPGSRTSLGTASFIHELRSLRSCPSADHGRGVRDGERAFAPVGAAPRSSPLHRAPGNPGGGGTGSLCGGSRNRQGGGTQVGVRVTVYDHRFADVLPFHLCSTAIMATAVLMLSRNRLAYELAYFWGFSGTLQAILTPDLEEPFSPSSLPELFLHPWTHHPGRALRHPGLPISTVSRLDGAGLRHHSHLLLCLYPPPQLSDRHQLRLYALQAGRSQPAGLPGPLALVHAVGGGSGLALLRGGLRALLRDGPRFARKRGSADKG